MVLLVCGEFLCMGLRGPATSVYAQALGASENQTEQDSQLVEQRVSVSENDTLKKEIVYASLAGNAQVKSLYVVNVLKSNEPGSVVDFGDYSSVQSLTEASSIVQENDAVNVDVQGDTLSYQGNATTKELPWNIEVTYLLDQKIVSPDDLAGKSGNLEIKIDTSQNEATDPAFFENYLMQISITLPEGNASSISAEAGQIVMAGSDTQVNFTAMPGKASSFTLKAEIENFEMEGISFAAVPFSMALDFSSTDALVEGLGQVGTGAEEIQDGTASLSSATSAISQAAGQLSLATSTFAQSMALFASGASELSSNSAHIASGLGTLSANGQSLAMSSAEIAGGLENTIAGLEALRDNTAPLDQATADEIDGYISALKSLQYNDFNSGLQQYVQGVNTLNAQYGAFYEGLLSLTQNAHRLVSASEQISLGTVAQGSGLVQLEEGTLTLAEGTAIFTREVQALPASAQEEIDNMLAAYDKSSFVPRSFMSDKNTNVELVQFVFATDPIEIAEEPALEEPETEDSIWTRFLALFGR
jgi:X-X-X-Leu-X-X-Gly heptad repeat protein